MLLQDPNYKPLSEMGNDYNRVGENKRNAKLKFLNRIEDLLREHVKYPMTVDIGSNEGPYFSKYTYTDMLEGIKLHTVSSEINLRVLQHCMDTAADAEIAEIDFTGLTDKYALDIPEGTESFKNVIMMAGINSTYLLDTNRIRDIMNSPENWYIKPHPITDDWLINELANYYGYDRILNPKHSGHAFFHTAEKLVVSATSEFLILAALKKKPFEDATRRSLHWRCTYGDYAHFMRNNEVDHNYETIKVLLGHPYSGYLHHSMSDDMIIERINNYVTYTQEIKQPFKMLTGQRLTAMDDTIGPLEDHASRRGRPINAKKQFTES